MEYINNDLAEFLEAGNYTDAMFNSIVKQVGLSLMEININCEISHNDVNSGNILLETGQPSKNIVYSIGDLTETVSTEGNEVIWIDFERSTKVKNKNNENSEELDPSLQSAIDDISHAYRVMSMWTKNIKEKQRLEGGMYAVIKVRTEEDLFKIILHV